MTAGEKGRFRDDQLPIERATFKRQFKERALDEARVAVTRARVQRAQEKTFKPSFKESRCAHLARLRRVAVTMPASFLTPLVKSMKRRCSAVAAANGGHIAD